MLPAERRRLSKQQRLQTVLKTLETLKPRFDAEGLWLLNVLFKIVEDQCTDAPFLSDGSNHQERMYGPSRAQLKLHSSLGSTTWEFWAKAHTTWIGINGAIRIAERRPNGATLLDHPGSDGRRLATE